MWVFFSNLLFLEKCDIIFLKTATFSRLALLYIVKAGVKTILSHEVAPMDDNKIISLYFARDEQAIEETKLKYGKLLRYIAKGILGNLTEAEECENDTYFRAWDSIPPNHPFYFSAYLCRIVRNISINRLKSNNRRNDREVSFIFNEISEVGRIGDCEIVDDMELKEAMNSFVRNLDPVRRKIFLQRYFYMMSISDISAETGIGVGTVKSILSRTRAQLRDYLTKRGIAI